MLVEKNYKRTKKGNIDETERVEIICDRCHKNWISSWASRKHKVTKEDLCKRCQALKAMSEGRIKPCDLNKNYPRKLPPKVEVVCLSCEKKMLRIPSHTNEKNNFCSVACRDKYWRETKYEHLEKAFEENINEVSYLFGLMMGDGHIRKTCKYTVRVSIAFDFSEKWTYLMDEAKMILNKLEINWFEETKSHNHCKMIGFVLPDTLLKKYNLYYYGAKFKSQPYPSEEVCHNINYVAGLLNSDGHLKQGRYYVFCNTVKSIADSFLQCLSHNGIKHSFRESRGYFDKRTNHISKNQYTVTITGGEKESKKLKGLCCFKLKE